MNDRLLRQISLIPNTDLLQEKTVAVIGLGGVGASAAAALARAGVGNIILVDHDIYEETNLNRQAFAYADTLGKLKTYAAEAELLRINPQIKTVKLNIFVNEENITEIVKLSPDFIVDAVDTVSAKKLIIDFAKNSDIPVISSMGTGNKLDATALKVGDIKDTLGCPCPLAKVMRKELEKMGIDNVPVVFSTEKPIKATVSEENGRHSPASAVFVPQCAGIIMAQYVITNMSCEN